MVCRRARALGLFTLTALLLAQPALLAGTPGATALPVAGDVNADGLVVVAVVDTGINPYHADFRRAALTAHPSTFLPGYPANARALDLSLDAESYADARAADRETFAGVETGRLYHVPGTKIVGAFTLEAGSPERRSAHVLPLIDDDGHGTAAASLAVGNQHGVCPECLLVVVEGYDGLQWAASQRWIDVVSNSWGTIGNAGVPLRGFGHENDWTHRAAEHGQTHLFAAGNGVENMFVTPEQTYASRSNGPDWVVNVGAIVRTEDGRERAVLGTGRPVDVVADGWGATAADAVSLTGTVPFSGTSASTPIAAGVFAETLRLVRDEVGWGASGQHWTAARWALAEAPPRDAGAFEDSTLTRAELWDAVYRAARATDGDAVQVYPATLPRTGLGWADALVEGYGVVDAATARAAAAHLLGHGTLPDRPDRDLVFTVDAFVRDALWGPWDRNGDGRRDIAALPGATLP